MPIDARKAFPNVVLGEVAAFRIPFLQVPFREHLPLARNARALVVAELRIEHPLERPHAKVIANLLLYALDADLAKLAVGLLAPHEVADGRETQVALPDLAIDFLDQRFGRSVQLVYLAMMLLSRPRFQPRFVCIPHLVKRDGVPAKPCFHRIPFLTTLPSVRPLRLTSPASNGRFFSARCRARRRHATCHVSAVGGGKHGFMKKFSSSQIAATRCSSSRCQGRCCRSRSPSRRSCRCSGCRRPATEQEDRTATVSPVCILGWKGIQGACRPPLPFGHSPPPPCATLHGVDR